MDAGPVETCPGTPREDAVPDPVANLNMTFRSLYGANRDQLLAETPLAALTLIGTGEIWRVEYGQVTKSYPPAELLPKIKGLMHAVLGAHGAWGLLLRNRDDASSKAAMQLNAALGEAIERVSAELPAELAAPAHAVLTELKTLSDAWRSGQEATADQFPAALKRVNPQLEEIIRAVGQACFDSLAGGFQALKDESDPDHWRQCFVGVCGPGQGRRDNIEIAAAMTIMGRDAVGVRLLYLENALSIPDGLRFLAAAIVEKDLGRAVFGDPYRMWRDLLAETAAEHAGGSFFPQLGPE
ncbi:MAG: hypothetical protein EKK29_19820 [Hyphomicrobiales bacterium]|nr:MAG: hypothetical protein EKK29_19820 [Hyphomicrobiales bacterium]